MVSPMINTFELVILAVCCLAVLGMVIYVRRKEMTVTPAIFRSMQLWAAVACLVTLLLFLGIASYGGGEYMVQTTPEKSPSNVFLTLTQDTMPEELFERSQEQGLFCVGPVPDGKTTEYYISADVLYLSHQEANGVLLKVCFSEDDGQMLSAKLTIRTDDGIARCWYYPTEDTEWFRPAGYTLKTKDGPLSLPRTSNPETAQDAIGYAYAVVYPNGM